MDYYESAEGIILTRGQAIQEINDHNAFNEIDDFYKEYGYQNFYYAQNVLIWLGY